MSRPSFSSAWAAFQEVNIPVAAIGKKLGGNIQKNIDAGVFENACPIRMSYVLNKLGYRIDKSGSHSVVSDSSKSLYIFRVSEMMDYLKAKLGNPDKSVRSPTTGSLAGAKGILVVKGHGWSNAKGHITLWNGSLCVDTCHLMYDPENGPFVPESAALWALP